MAKLETGLKKGGEVCERQNGGSSVCLVWLWSSSPDGFHEQDLTPNLHSAGTLLHPLHPLPPSYHSYTQHLIVPHCQILHFPNHLRRKSYFVPLQTQPQVSPTVLLTHGRHCKCETRPRTPLVKNVLWLTLGVLVFSTTGAQCFRWGRFANVNSKEMLKPLFRHLTTLLTQNQNHLLFAKFIHAKQGIISFQSHFSTVTCQLRHNGAVFTCSLLVWHCK